MVGPWVEASCLGLLRVTLPHQSGHSVHIGYPHHFILYNLASAHDCYHRPCKYCHTQGIWVMNPLWWLIPSEACHHSSKTWWLCCL